MTPDEADDLINELGTRGVSKRYHFSPAKTEADPEIQARRDRHQAIANAAANSAHAILMRKA